MNFRKSPIKNSNLIKWYKPFYCLWFDIVAIRAVSDVTSCKIVNSSTKFKSIHKISVSQETFLVFFLTCSEGRIKLLRGPDPARGPRVVHPCCKTLFQKEISI